MRKWLSLMLTACMLLSIAGISTAFATEDRSAKYDPPIEVTFVRATDDTIENNVLAKLPGETLEDNRWTKLIEQELGIKIKYLWIAKGSEQYTTKFNTSIASGDIPDIMIGDKSRVKNLLDADSLQPLGGVIDQYANTILKKILQDAGEASFLPAMRDGETYGMPLTNSSLDSVSVLWMREDWLSKYGLQKPKTIDELISTMKTFNEGVGEGAVGLTISKSLGDQLKGFFNGFGAYYNCWVAKDGKLVFGSVQPEMKQALAKLSEMYAEGLLDTEFAVKDGGKALEAIVGGKSGMYYGWQWSPLWPMNDCVAKFPEADFTPCELPTVDGSPARAGIDPGTAEWYVVNKDCAYPEALVKLMNLYVDKTFDPLKQDYLTYSNDGKGVEAIWKLTPVYQFTPLKNLENHWAVRKAFEDGNADALFGEQRAMYDFCKQYVDGDATCWGWNRVFGVQGSWSIIEHYYLEDRLELNAFLGVPSDSMTDYSSTLASALDETFTKIIMGQAPVDDFDAAVSNWLNGGGQEMTDDANAWYDTVKDGASAN